MDANETMQNQSTTSYLLNTTHSFLQDEIHKRQCQSGPLPTATDIVRNLTAATGTYHVILIILAAIVVGLFIDELFFLKANIKSSARRRLSILQAGIPPTFVVSSVVGTFFPSGSLMIDFVCSIYFGFALHAFLVLMVNYFGGLRQLLLRFGDKSCVIHTGPFCCCCLCLPSFKMTKKNFTVLWYATFQAAFTRPIVLFFEGVFQIDHSVPIPALVYTVCLIATTLTGMWALVVFRRAAGEFLGSFHLTGKFLNFQAVLLITNLQPFLIKMFYHHCDLPYTYNASKLVLNYQIMVIEFFLWGITTRLLYRRESDNQQLDRIVNDNDSTKDGYHNSDVITVETPMLRSKLVNNDAVTKELSTDNRLDSFIV